MVAGQEALRTKRVENDFDPRTEGMVDLFSKTMRVIGPKNALRLFSVIMVFLPSDLRTESLGLIEIAASLNCELRPFPKLDATLSGQNREAFLNRGAENRAGLKP